MNSDDQKDKELDRIFLLLSQPLTIYILSVLSGIDPGRFSDIE